MTQIDELMTSEFKNPTWTLFKLSHSAEDSLELDLEDGVRYDLFIDNLKLHQIHVDAHDQENANPKNPKKKTPLSSQIESEKTINNTKYLRRIFKVLVQWDNTLNANKNAEQQ
jgi:hypothetical protein